jgi:hypothetical protein
MGLSLTGAARSMVVALASTLAVIPAAPAHAGAVPPTVPVVIDVVTANGSGCPNADATAVVAPDNSGFTVRHRHFFATAGLGAGPTDFRKNCQINLQATIPDGYTYAIAGGDRDGFLHLPDGAAAVQRTTYYFAGSSQTATREYQFDGPYSDFWRTVDEFSDAELIWAPCNATRNLNINTEVRVRTGTSDPETSLSFMLLGTSPTAVSHYRLAWRLCGG